MALSKLKNLTGDYKKKSVGKTGEVFLSEENSNVVVVEYLGSDWGITTGDVLHGVRKREKKKLVNKLNSEQGLVVLIRGDTGIESEYIIYPKQYLGKDNYLEKNSLNTVTSHLLRSITDVPYRYSIYTYGEFYEV